MTSLQLATLGIQALGFGAVTLGLWLTRRAHLADHDRRRKQATIEFVNELRPKWRDCYTALQNQFGYEVLTDADAKRVADTPDLRAQARELLALTEHLSVGVNTGVYDRDMLFRICGSYLIGVYGMMQTYIRLCQQTSKTLYIEFAEIAEDFADRRRLRPEGGQKVLRP
jgi:hypothetical protein